MEDERKWCVYVHENKNNGKRYVGITCQNLNRRWRNGEGYSCNTHFYNSIKKNGWNDGFYHYCISENLTNDEANKEEESFIKLWNLTDKRFGYNITLGGDGVKGLFGDKNSFYGKKHTKETIEKIRKANLGKKLTLEHIEKLRDISKTHTGDKNPMYGRTGDKSHWYGKKHSNETIEKMKKAQSNKSYETRRKISNTLKGKYVGELNPMYGYKYNEEQKKRMSIVRKGEKHTEEVKEKMSIMRRGGNNYWAKTVLCEDKIFECTRECSEYYKLKQSTLKGWLNGSAIMPKEWYDKGLKYKDEGDIVKTRSFIVNSKSDTCRKGKDHPNSKMVLCKNILFDSVTACAIHNGVSVGTINSYLTGNKKMSQKYIDLGLRYATQREISEYQNNTYNYNSSADELYK